MSTETLNLDAHLLDYLRRHSLRESPLLARLREETARLPMARMQISPEQGQFMGLLVRLIGARHAVEIGTFTGYSALCVAGAMPEDGHLFCCDVSEEWTSIARRYFDEAGLCPRITLKLAPALETLAQLRQDGWQGRIDFAFIDADKENYSRYYEVCLDLLRPGGLIAIDNVLWSGKVAEPDDGDADTQAIRALNDALLMDQRVDISLLPIGDGLTLARKRA